MDKQQKIDTFQEVLGQGSDPSFARDLLEAHDWNLEAALSMVTGQSAPSRQVQPVEEEEQECRAPMRTGYVDRLVGPTSQEQERQRQAEEAAYLAEQRQREEQQRVLREAREAESRQQKVEEERRRLEAEALERRQQKARQRAAERQAAVQQAHASGEVPRTTDAVHDPQTKDNTPQEVSINVLNVVHNESATKIDESQQQKIDEQARRREEKEAEDTRREREEAAARSLEAQKQAQVTVEKPSEELVQALRALRKKYKDEDPKGLVTCLQTLRTYINNLARNPHEQKFQRINADNNAFRTRVAAFDGAVPVLKACGFTEEDGAFIMSQAALKTRGLPLFDALAKVDIMLEQARSST